ncbi:putative tyrosine-protein phosphatase [Podospora australis]|uniref:diphosphoinositol-polyphosphate diphosphatase n=1 Tax=Podospora australis TaxID=1536484 RepID=A0AAN6X1K2_9PEZI|nr:putative tyrosine-protein phosphatase [Podospora australis]
MASGGAVAVSKRSGRQYMEDEMEKDAPEYSTKRALKYDDVVAIDGERKTSLSTATSHSSQSSLEPSPLMQATDLEQDVEKLHLANQERRGSLSGLQDAFHPSGIDRTHVAKEESLPSDGRPANFGIVVPGVYRSSFPQAEDYGFIEGLKLKTIVTLVQKEFPESYRPFIEEHGIKHHVFDMKGTKKEEIPISTMKSILRLVLDTRNHPLLIHCNHGKHRTGCVVAIVRKISGWDLSNVLNEYKKFAEPKIRDCDVKYITGFEPTDISNLFREATWRFRSPSFLRATVVAAIVLFVWVYSDSMMIPASPQ